MDTGRHRNAGGDVCLLAMLNSCGLFHLCNRDTGRLHKQKD